jgi:hypothetical protein
VTAHVPDEAIAAARAALGLGPTPTWIEVRVAYRAQIGAAHPDRSGGSTTRAAELNAAYGTLQEAHRQGRLRQAPPPRPAPQPPSTRGDRHQPAPHEEGRWRVPAEVLEGDTLHVHSPPDEAFARVLDACHRIGDVTYVDRSCAIIEVLLRIENEGTCSLVVTLQPSAGGTDAFCTLESIERVASPPVRPVAAALAEALRKG